MDGWTIGAIVAGIGVILTLISGLKKLDENLKGYVRSAMKEETEDLKKDISGIKAQLTKVDLESCKNYLVAQIAAVDRGEKMSDTQAERFWEQYGHYKDTGGNSYIKHKVETLQKEGKL